jgi:hypothetical protein
MFTKIKLFFALPLLACYTQICIAQNTFDEATADELAKVYKDDDVICLKANRYFTFDKGKNVFDEKVVVVEEDAENEFMALKKFSNVTYAQYYNKFIEIKTFKRQRKYNGNYVTEERTGTDRSANNDDFFFDDSRVRYHAIGFNQKGGMSKVNSRIEYTDAKYLTKIWFNTYYPIKEQNITFKVPEWLQVEFVGYHLDGYEIQKTQQKKGSSIIYNFFLYRSAHSNKSKNL